MGRRVYPHKTGAGMTPDTRGQKRQSLFLSDPVLPQLRDWISPGSRTKDLVELATPTLLPSGFSTLSLDWWGGLPPLQANGTGNFYRPASRPFAAAAS